ncbi:MAG: phosphotransferase family protein [Kiloniellales bacterium]
MTTTLAEERLAEARPRLEGFLARAAGAEEAELLEARPLSGGAIQENWLLECEFSDGPEQGRRELVLRSDSLTGVAVSLSRPQEFALLRAAAAAGVTVPEPLWLCEDAAVLGRPFYVMRKLAGTAAGHLIVKDEAASPVPSQAAKDALAERLGRELARIHSIRPNGPGGADLAFLGDPPADPASVSIAAYRAHLDDLGVAQPALEWGLRWCELQAPPPGDIVLIHQDFRTGNYMVGPDGLTGILDWEFCAWGDPMSDIGWFCAKCWRFGRDDREAGGIAAREPFYRGYEAEAGRRIDPAAVAYWEVMAHLRWAVIALQQGARVLDGGPADQRGSLELALTGRIRPAELELEILAQTAPGRWPIASGKTA